jgi:hypothetical protein
LRHRSDVLLLILRLVRSGAGGVMAATALSASRKASSRRLIRGANSAATSWKLLMRSTSAGVRPPEFVFTWSAMRFCPSREAPSRCLRTATRRRALQTLAVRQRRPS